MGVSIKSNFIKLGIVLGILLQLQGCLITSPFWGYKPGSTNEAIPFQIWTYFRNDIVVECTNNISLAHSAPRETAIFNRVTTIPISNQASLDGQGSPMYSASKNIVLPASCWTRSNDSNNYSITIIRVYQMQPNYATGGTQKVIFDSFDKTGLECLGREVGKAQSWFGYLDKGCEKRYSGGSNPEKVPYIPLRVNH